MKSPSALLHAGDGVAGPPRKPARGPVVERIAGWSAHGLARRASGIFPGMQQCVRAFHGSLTGLWPSFKDALQRCEPARAGTSGRPPDPG